MVFDVPVAAKFAKRNIFVSQFPVNTVNTKYSASRVSLLCVDSSRYCTSPTKQTNILTLNSVSFSLFGTRRPIVSL